MQKLALFVVSGLIPIVFVLAFTLGQAPYAAAAETCAAVPGYTLQTFAFCTTTTVTVSGTSAKIVSTTVRKDNSGVDKGLPPSNPGWDIASDLRVYTDGGAFYCGSSTSTISCTIDNLLAGSHQLQTNWIGSKAGQTMFTENFDSYTVSLPNLTVSSITPIGTPTINQSFAIQAVITNNGSAAAGSSWAQTVVGPSGNSNAAISGFTVPALAAGSSYTASFSYTPTTVGTHSINVCADVNNNVVESNENSSDNCRTVSVTVSAPAVSPVSADLRGDGANGPLTIAFRQSVQLSWTSTNATGCTIIIPGSNPYSQNPTGSMTAGPFEASGTVSLTCTGAGGASGSDTLTINVGSAPTPSISNVFATPGTLAQGEYLTITIVGENFGASPGVLEEMTGYGGTVRNSYVRGEYNQWDLTWSSTQIALRVYPSITQTYPTGANTVYVRVANQFNQRSSIQPVTATVAASQTPSVTGSPAPSLTEVYVNPRPGIRGRTATAFFNGVLNADSCAFQYKSTADAAWGSATSGSCTSGITFNVPADLPQGLYLFRGRACRNDGTCSDYRQMTGEWQINPAPDEPAVVSGRASVDGFRVVTPDTLSLPVGTTNVRITATLRQASTASLYYSCRTGFNVLTAANTQLACNDETTNTFPLSNDSGGFRTVEVNLLVSNTGVGGTADLRLNTAGLDGVRVSRSATFTLAGGTASTTPVNPTTPTARATINAFSFTVGSFSRSHPTAVSQPIVSVSSGAQVSFTGSYTLAGSTANDWLDLGCQNDNVANVTINGFAYCRQGANGPYRNPILSNPFTATLTNTSTTQTNRVVLVLRVSDRQGIQEASLPLDVLPAATGSATAPLPPATGSITFTADNQTNLTVEADRTATFRVVPQGTIASATFECSYNPGGITLEFNGVSYCAGGTSSPVPIGLSIFPATVTFRNPTSQLQQVVAVIKAKDAGGNIIDQKQVVVNVNRLVSAGTGTQTQAQGQAQSQTSARPRPLVRSQNNEQVFAIVNGQRFWIPDAQTFEAAGYRWSDVRVVPETQVRQYSRLRLVRAGTDAAVYYITESGLKRLIPSPAVFASYGNRWDDVVSISQVELAAYRDVGFIHRGDGRVYKLENGVKRWVKTVEAFRRIGGRWDEIAPVNQTEFDAYPTGADIE